MSKIDIVRKIHAQWEAIAYRAGVRGAHRAALATLPQSLSLLGTSIKVEKGEKEGVLTSILYLSPATESGRTTCPWASQGCAAACLVGSGQLSMQENARLWKTAIYFGARELFFSLLNHEIAALEKKAAKLGKKAAVRLDGTSDLGIALRFAPQFPAVQFYDYTKSVKRALQTRTLPNYSATFSYSGSNGREARKVLSRGGNVAVAFNALPAIKGRREAEALPESWRGFPILDGDLTDLRFDDKAGHVVGLRFKASADRGKRLKLAGRFVQACQNS